VIEYSAELSDSIDIQALCDRLFEKVAAHPAVTNSAALRVRAIPCPAYRLGIEAQTFAHATLHLLSGRDDKTKSDLAQTILQGLVTALPDVGSLTVNLTELDASYAKRML
jgi:5-carboxymethyl-2-hydroxymuconate isomerase